ncbi:hypothetical protein HF086_015941 [Spodoptera exigua]|uniref:Neurogenic protein big brain n=1 Tax=Spodoptera exigua TaxID=7107 RepID=A0A922S817_SPOEX|nr:hypothetical protein HF086_015941 [Spodoptera exigua]
MKNQTVILILVKIPTPNLTNKKALFSYQQNYNSVSVPGYAGGLSASLPGGGSVTGAAWERLGAELVLSALVAAAYFAAMERRWTGAAPALLGAAYCAASFVSMPSLNPARSLGPSFVLSRWESHWVSWVGGLGGGVASALLHEWGGRRARGTSSRASSPRDLDELDKPAFPSHHHYRHAPTYCAAAPRPDTAEPLYSGTKSLYCRSPPPARHGLHRSQSVYSKGSSATSGAASSAAATSAVGGGPLVAATSLVLRPPTHTHAHHALAHNQNAHNAQRDPPYGTANGAAVNERRESVYSGSVGGASASGVSAGVGAGVGAARQDDAYGTYSRAPHYRSAHAQHTLPSHY